MGPLHEEYPEDMIVTEEDNNNDVSIDKSIDRDVVGTEEGIANDGDLGTEHDEHDSEHSDDEFEDCEEDEDDCEEDEEEEVEEVDDFALLALAKQRLVAQQAKEDEDAKASAKAAEESDDDDDNDFEEAELDDDEESDEEASDEESNEEVAKDEIPEPNSAQVSLPVSSSPSRLADTTTPVSSPPRKRRDENSELWALLQQSKSRVEESKDLIAAVEKEEQQQETGDNDGAPGISTGAVALGSTEDESEEKLGDDSEAIKTKEDLARENRELWALLQQSKQRLEEAAMRKAEEAERAAAADQGPTTPKQPENPYKDIDQVPDEQVGDGDGAEDLTQKELLLAMAVAEEAARSGKTDFVSPPKDELRTRDIESFDFLKEEAKPSIESVPVTPIRNAEEEATELKRYERLKQRLGKGWSQFRQRVSEIDQASRGS